ncbi:integrase domain-containing protein [Limnobacter sp.]|uniref:integrase domain-containing protein n=2 Tax=Limnobacter sp. TaxID=2003368 RepID=UPI0025C4CE95|nr:integrase domain-containing protein [Limnobacter sp.]
MVNEKKMSLAKSAKELAKSAGGSHSTVETRTRIIMQLVHNLRFEQNVQIRTISQLREKNIENWLRSGKEKGLSPRTLQNRLTAVRTVLTQAERYDTLSRLQNTAKKVGFAGASRDGVRKPPSEEQLNRLLANVNHQGVRICLEMMNEFGLRQKESIMSAGSLDKWLKDITSDRHGRFQLVQGSKGGRPREIWPNDPAKAAALVSRAIDYARQNGGKLIEGDLKQALGKFNRVAGQAGFKGLHSPHSLRYAFAQRTISRLIEQGWDKRLALSFTSQVLGHGDGRGRWIDQVYSKN